MSNGKRINIFRLLYPEKTRLTKGLRWVHLSVDYQNSSRFCLIDRVYFILEISVFLPYQDFEVFYNMYKSFMGH